jgi:beta-lactamase class A
MLVRRDFLIGTALIASAPAWAASRDQIAGIEQRLRGRIGVSMLDTATGRRFHDRGGERFAMCSTFKAALAGAVLARVDRGELTLDRKISYGDTDLLSNAPVAALCEAAVEVSDNTAANLLLSLIGGPPGFTAFLRTIGDPVTRLDRTELDLNTNLPHDPRDTTTPDAMLGTLQALLLEDHVLKPASRDLLTGWMLQEKNGAARIRAGLPPDWRVANKPGTSAEQAGATNDIAVAWPPSGKPVVITIYTDARKASLEQRSAAIAETAKIVTRRVG